MFRQWLQTSAVPFIFAHLNPAKMTSPGVSDGLVWACPLQAPLRDDKHLKKDWRLSRVLPCLPAQCAKLCKRPTSAGTCATRPLSWPLSFLEMSDSLFVRTDSVEPTRRESLGCRKWVSNIVLQGVYIWKHVSSTLRLKWKILVIKTF